MDTNKKVQMEEAGWAVGSTQDFLGLSDEETAHVDSKLKFLRPADRGGPQPIGLTPGRSDPGSRASRCWRRVTCLPASICWCAGCLRREQPERTPLAVVPVIVNVRLVASSGRPQPPRNL